MKLIFLIMPLMLVASCEAASISTAEGIAVGVDEKSGAYEFSARQPGWKFGGGLNCPLKNVNNTHGNDAVGDYEQISFEWQSSGTSMRGGMRLYKGKSVVLFSQSCNSAMELPPAAFPSFTKVPVGLHFFSYANEEFSPPRFEASDVSTPWLLFDDSANALIISPASHVMVASMVGDGRTEVASGFNPNLRHLPAGFTQQTIIACSKGIDRTWDLWGQSLLALQKAVRPSCEADDSLKYLGYWTDNGMAYYYNYDLSKGYAGTLEELVRRYRNERIPVRYLQLDSWWYYKTTTNVDGTPGAAKKVEKLPEGEWNRYGGLWEYRAHPYVFPNGLSGFQKLVGLPLVTHNRWVDRASPYAERYKISGVAAVDPKWWDHIAAFLKESDAVTYEQDWLDEIYAHSLAFSSVIGTAESFLDDMSRACREKGITMQYCMPYPCYFLQGSRYANLTSIRVSGDRFNTDRWQHFLYTSRLASALGIWPWTDACMSTERNNLLLSTLSAGPVGIGDMIGSETKTNLEQAVRGDGVIVKPDAPIVPLDQTYITDARKEAAPMLACTYTDHDGIRTEYVFAFNRSSAHEKVDFSLNELGLKRRAYVYDYFAGTGRKLSSSGNFSASLGRNTSAYYVVAPVGRSGIAFLGDRDKFVGTGKERIPFVRDEPGRLSVRVELGEIERMVMLHGYADRPPKVSVPNGTAGNLKYDATTGYFTIEVRVDSSTRVDRSGADPVRQFTVVFETGVK